MDPRRLAAHAAAVLLLLVGVGAQLFRPLAPDLGPLPDPSPWFDAAYLDQAWAYRRPINVVGVIALLLRLAIPLAVAFTSLGRRAVDAVVDRVGDHRPARAATAVVLGVVVLTDLVVLPLSFWASFVHEGRFGFRTQGLGAWAADWLLAKGPLWIAVAVVTLVGWTLARRLPRTWPAVGALGATVATAGVVVLAPLVLEPLTFRTVPLPPGEVREEVERVIAASGERIDRILVADASRRTTKHNAYVSGLGGTRRVVLYDTLVEGQPPDEVALVLAHELGHHRNADHLRAVLFAGSGLVVAAYVLAWLTARRSRAGRQRGVTDPRGAAVVLAVVVLLNALSLPVQNAASRRAEAAADLAAIEITEDPEGFQRMMARLGRSNLSLPAPPRWVVWLWASHPPTAARLEMGARWPFEERSR